MYVLRNILAGSRFLIIIAVLATLISSFTVLVYGAITVGGVIVHVFALHIFSIEEVKNVAITSVELIDLFLLSTILYIVSLGLYRLFIDAKLPLPDWLEINNLDDLKGRILAVITVLLAISFLGFVVEWHLGDYSILALGVAVGLVLFALSYLLSSGAIRNRPGHIGERNDKNKEEEI